MFIFVACLMTSISVVAQEAYAEFTSDNTTLTFFYDDLRSSRTGTTYDLRSNSSYPGWRNDGNYSSVTKVVFDPSFAAARPITTRYWFDRMYNLKTILGIEHLNTTMVKDMSKMFSSCTGLASLDVSHFNTAKVTNMSDMFNDCKKLSSLDVSSFNTENVTSMRNMFSYCRHLTSIDLSHFNTTKVTDMYGMFSNSNGLTTVYVGSNWSTEAVTSSENMFNNCTSLVGGKGTTYDSDHVDVSYAHDDGGPSNPGYLTALSAYAVYTSSDKTLTFYYDNLRSTRTGYTYDLNTGSNSPDWNRYWSPTQVVFDPSFAAARPTTTHDWFRGMSRLASITGMEFLNTSEVTDMSDMFSNCQYLTSLDVSSFNTSHVTDMSSMFSGCYRLTSLDLSNLNTSHVTDMSSMFSGCNGLTSLDVSNFNTSHVTDMSSMFSGCYRLTSLDVGNLITSNVTDMSSMFYGCSGLTSLDLSNFNTSSVTNISSMFRACSGLTSLDLSNFNTENVTDISSMFYGCSGLRSLDVSNFNTGNVTDISSMFYACSGLKSLDVSGFNTVNVTNMGYMFYGCNGLSSLEVSSFNTDNVTTMGYMFYACSGLISLDLSSFNTSHVTSMSGMFEDCYDLGTIYVDSCWSTDCVIFSYGMFYNCYSLVGGRGTPYDEEYVGATYARIDNGPIAPGYFSSKSFSGLMAYAEYDDRRGILTFYFDDQRSTRTGTTYNLNRPGSEPAWLSCYVSRVVFHPSFADARPISTSCWFANMSLLSVTGLEYLNTTPVIDMSYMFYCCDGMEHKFDLSHFNTVNVTNMHSMFEGCFCPERLDLSSFDTSNVTDMGDMFRSSIGLSSLDLSNFDTSNVTDMSSMFSNIYGLTSLNLSSFNTEKVTDMMSMFECCYNLSSLDLSSFNTENVREMMSMFEGCESLTSLDLSSFNTENVWDMRSMFEGCESLTSLDLSSFNTGNVKRMHSMYKGCSNLSTIYVGSGWSTESLSDLWGRPDEDMFYGCTSLVGGMGTTYDEEHVDAEYAHIDGGPENPGYFTDAQTALPGDVDGDGSVGISDVTTLIDYLLNSSTPIVNEVADVDGNGSIDIADVTALIDILLSGDS